MNRHQADSVRAIRKSRKRRPNERDWAVERWFPDEADRRAPRPPAEQVARRPSELLVERSRFSLRPARLNRPSLSGPAGRADRGVPRGLTATPGPKGRTKQAFRAAPRLGRRVPETSYRLRQRERRSMYRYILCLQRLSTQNLVSFDMKITSQDWSEGTPNWAFKATEGCLCGEVVSTVLLSSRPNA